MADNVPKHVVFVPDGNRRFARKHGKHPSEGHRAGADTFREVLKWCKELGIKEVTFWGASTENLKRDKLELEFLFKLFGELCDEVMKRSAENHPDRASVKFCGALHMLPKWLQERFAEAEKATMGSHEYKLNLLIAYGGREELLQAVRSIARDASEGKLSSDKITGDTIMSRLYLQSEPDLIIRTGHACMSGLLPWQSVYSEIIFLEEKHWPEFNREDLEACLKEYSERIRNFGK
ncbi:di-trans,poly-cis-decaprenylcistransferase [Candidatus Woesearchaeota archaeon]|nr:di-trans,poly-cis-decaprenylcistransferase [Candidatus Woesearchaeota archaeon]